MVNTVYGMCLPLVGPVNRPDASSSRPFPRLPLPFMTGRVVQLVGNSYITFSNAALAPGHDYVQDDLDDVPHVLRRVRDSWWVGNATDCQR